ncbi:MAG: DUF3341 domain-containing protein [bacterium]|nr:DUF3341 domain-containing protein [bacterium]
MSEHEHENETAKRFEFDSREEFLEKLEELTQSGVKPAEIETLTPFHVHEVEHILKTKPSVLRFVALGGALLGFLSAWALMIYTVLDWPLRVGGKPLISTPAFIVIAFECTILFGGVITFLGFLGVNKLPSLKRIVDPRECGNQFIIIQQGADNGVAK